MKRFWTIALVWSATISFHTASAAVAQGCDVVKAAEIKLVHTPHKATMTTQYPSGTVVMVQINTTETTYNHLGNFPWGAHPNDAAKEEAGVIKYFASDTRVCTLGGQEMVGEQMADVYAEVTPSARSANRRRIWVSPTLGLPLKAEVEQQVGGPSVLVYEYNDVQPPTDLPK
jgi:hypothetical protein